MRDYLKSFKKNFNDSFNNTLNYEQIRDRVVITKNYQTNGLIVHKSRFVAILVLFALLGGVFLMLATNKVIYVEQTDRPVNFSSVQKTVEWADFVFIAKVEKKLYTKQFDGTGFQMPYSYYSLTDINFLKGEGKKKDKLLFYGGYDFLNNKIVFADNKVLPDPGEYYIFSVKRTAPISGDLRAEIDSYFVLGEGQMRLLDGYISKKGINEQSATIKQIIKAYLDALENNK